MPCHKQFAANPKNIACDDECDNVSAPKGAMRCPNERSYRQWFGMPRASLPSRSGLAQGYPSPGSSFWATATLRRRRLVPSPTARS